MELPTRRGEVLRSRACTGERPRTRLRAAAPFLAVSALRRFAKSLGIARALTRIAYDGADDPVALGTAPATATCQLYGLEVDHNGGLTRAYVLDTATDAVPLTIDTTEQGARLARPTDDRAPPIPRAHRTRLRSTPTLRCEIRMRASRWYPGATRDERRSSLARWEAGHERQRNGDVPPPSRRCEQCAGSWRSRWPRAAVTRAQSFGRAYPFFARILFAGATIRDPRGKGHECGNARIDAVAESRPVPPHRQASQPTGGRLSRRPCRPECRRRAGEMRPRRRQEEVRTHDRRTPRR
jgi:hypothetical protein